MNVPVEYAPRTFGEIIGRGNADLVSSIIKKRLASPQIEIWGRSHTFWTKPPLRLGIVGDSLEEATALANLMAKAHFCTSGEDGGPCGECQICHSFERENDFPALMRKPEWIIGDSLLAEPYQSPVYPSMTPSIPADELNHYAFLSWNTALCNRQDFQDCIELICADVCHFPYYVEDGAYALRPEAAILEAVSAADTIRQDAIIDKLDETLVSSLLLPLHSSEVPRLNEKILSGLELLYLHKPELGEAMEFAAKTAEEAGITISKEMLNEIASIDGIGPASILRILRLAEVDDMDICKAWLKQATDRLNLPMLSKKEAVYGK